MIVIDHNESQVLRLASQELLEQHFEVRAFCDLQLTIIDDGDGEHLLTIDQQNGSSVTVVVVSLGGSRVRKVVVNQLGDDCRTVLNGLSVGRQDEKQDFSSVLTHCGLRGTSNQLFKYILSEQAVGSFYGGLCVKPGAQKTEAYQTNRNLLLSPSARVNTKPQLEIYADDVKCSHGASTGQMDATALFYMQQRGIPEKVARHLLVNAFAADTLAPIADEQILEELQQRIANRLQL